MFRHPPGLSMDARVETADVIVTIFDVSIIQVCKTLIKVSCNNIGLCKCSGIIDDRIRVFGWCATCFGRHQSDSGFTDFGTVLLHKIYHFLRSPISKVHIRFILNRYGIKIYSILFHEIDVTDKMIGVCSIVLFFEMFYFFAVHLDLLGESICTVPRTCKNYCSIGLCRFSRFYISIPIRFVGINHQAKDGVAQSAFTIHLV